MDRWEVIETDGVYTIECTDEALCTVDDVCPLTFDNQEDADWLCAFMKALETRVEEAGAAVEACGPQTETITTLNATIVDLQQQLADAQQL